MECKSNVKDFDTLLKLEKLVNEMLHKTADHRRRNANTRKDLIIAKLLMEFFRPSPFELTDKLTRTQKKWEKLKLKPKERKESILERQLFAPDNLFPEKTHEQGSEDDESMKLKKLRLQCRCQSGLSAPENSKVSTSISHKTSSHKNKRTSTVTSPKSSKVTDIFEATSSEIYMQKSTTVVCPSKNSDSDIPETANSKIGLNKPSFIITNNRKLITADSKVSMNFLPTLHLPTITHTVTEEWFSFIPSVSVFSTPPKLSIIDDHLTNQTIKFTITNSSNKYVYLKYIDITDKAYFSYAKVCPNHSHKVYPGMSVTFKLSFKLTMRKKVFTSTLFFRVTCNRIYDRPIEGFNVPIVSDYLKTRAVSVSEAVYLPSIYPWHFTRGIKDPGSTGIIEVTIHDGYSYHLHINKRSVDLSQPEEYLMSTTNATAYMVLSSLSTGKLELDIAIITESLVIRALDTFFIDTTYMYFKTQPKKYKIPVYLNTIEHVGCHSCYYDLTFYDSYTDEFIFRKTTRIFADILPCPVEVSPPILDMSSVPINHSFGETVFYITNNHKLFPVSIKIILTTKMKRLFRVIPMETVIPTTTKVTYQVKFCTLDTPRIVTDNMVYFTFEIAMFGPKFIYKDMPHIYYEVIAPCLIYYKEITNRIEELLDDLGKT